MSRIGKQPVVAPSGVTISVGKDNVVTVKGPKGELKQAIDRDITVEVKDGEVSFSRPTDQIRHRALFPQCFPRDFCLQSSVYPASRLLRHRPLLLLWERQSIQLSPWSQKRGPLHIVAKVLS